MRTRKNFKIQCSLFFTMLKIGLFTFGGGYAMISLIEAEIVSKKKWISRSEFLDILAIAESTPGPIAINSATYIGYKICGFIGSVCASIAVCIPSFVIIYVISLFFDAFLSLELVGAAFKGIQVCVIYLIFSAGRKMLRSLERTPLTLGIFFAVLILMVVLSLLSVRISSIVFILASGFLGAMIYGIRCLRTKKADISRHDKPIDARKKEEDR